MSWTQLRRILMNGPQIWKGVILYVKICFIDNINKDDFKIHILNSFPNEDNGMLDVFENLLASSCLDALTLEVLNYLNKKRTEMNKRKQKSHCMLTNSNLMVSAASVANMVIS